MGHHLLKSDRREQRSTSSGNIKTFAMNLKVLMFGVALTLLALSAVTLAEEEAPVESAANDDEEGAEVAADIQNTMELLAGLSVTKRDGITKRGWLRDTWRKHKGRIINFGLDYARRRYGR